MEPQDRELQPAAPEASKASEKPAPRRRRTFFQRPHELHDRVTLYVVRGLFFLVAAGISVSITQSPGLEISPVNQGLIILGACALAAAVIIVEMFCSRAPVRTLAAIAFGLMMGFVISRIFEPVALWILATKNPDAAMDVEVQRLIQLITTTIFCFFGVTVLLQTKDDFKFIIPYVEFRKEVRGRTPLVLDTSVIIDGRVAALLETRIIDQRLVVPRFVLDELQSIADSSDRSRRERGRRGLDLLEEIRRLNDIEVLEKDLPAGLGVDRGLLELVDDLKGKLLTSDFNLQKLARVQGLPVININDLATALKPVVVPGESLRVRLLRQGEEPGQAVGFLGDGTMVVVENSSRSIGREVVIEVTSATQTSAGKMIFGRLRRFPPRKFRDDSGGRDGGRQETGRAGAGAAEAPGAAGVDP